MFASLEEAKELAHLNLLIWQTCNLWAH